MPTAPSIWAIASTFGLHQWDRGHVEREPVGVAGVDQQLLRAIGVERPARWTSALSYQSRTAGCDQSAGRRTVAVGDGRDVALAIDGHARSPGAPADRRAPGPGLRCGRDHEPVGLDPARDVEAGGLSRIDLAGGAGVHDVDLSGLQRGEARQVVRDHAHLDPLDTLESRRPVVRGAARTPRGRRSAKRPHPTAMAPNREDRG